MDDVLIQNFPRLTLAEAQPRPCERPAFALYIDADNQSVRSAAALLDLLQQDVGGHISRVIVAGNDKGNKNEAWIKTLREQIPELVIENLSVPCRPNAADIALILALGADVAEHRQNRTRVVVVSRDTLLLDAAEQVKAAGVRLYVAYADGEVPTARRTNLTTFLLPSLSDPPQAAASTTELMTTPARQPLQPVLPTPSAIPNEVAIAMAHLRATCQQQPGGGYSTTDVGQALTTLGYKTAAARRQILAQFPNFREEGRASQKRLIF
ncbi:NYN domain-containing protein [Thiorhodococcus mannitoliphagus]|uniref:NYN domain-containing protein n=1 Tax=Thiorhodococcus mannitoliphagus TaxID=329406 RepID=A0A6P1DLB7_9GAMM|nr:NYN domain-containing protein [Thiorhodococcus mannitoliphagus]NEX19027.1 NYN domain-containing protein [Thiorhodococcus mannitoliphagus]